MKDILEKIIEKSTYIDTPEELDKVFNKSWKKIKKSFYKLEVEQYYECDIDEVYNDFINNKYEKLIENLIKFSNDWPKELRKISNLDIRRLHILEKPLSDYIKYEMYYYLVNEKNGENIRCIKDSKTTDGINDFIIFDNKEIIINIHDASGVHIYSYYYKDNSNLIEELLIKYKEIYEKAKHYSEFYKFNKKVMKILKEKNII